jgi:hypothetical protein
MDADLDELRARIRSQISAGELPCMMADATHTSRADGRSHCDICGEVLAQNETQFEEEFQSATGADVCSVVAHRQCRDLWFAICKLEYTEFHNA